MSSRSIPVLCLLIVAAQTMVSAQVGQTGLAFLKLGVGARSIGMGEAYSAIASDPSAMYYNPAALSLDQSSQLLLMHKEWIQDTRIEYIAAKAAMSKLTLGISLNSTSVDNIEIREHPGPSQGTFDSHNAAVGISGAYRVDSCLSIGATGKFLYEKILTNEASGFGVDLGGWYQTPWNIQLALAVSNLGSVNELDQEAAKIPTIIRAGGAYVAGVESIDGSLTISSDLVSYTGESTTHLHVGAEVNYRQALSLRAGYMTGYDARSFTSGVGFRYSQFQLDYAFAPTKFDLGSTHTFSLMIEFN
jgi:uncharacterized protein UPF0164